MSQTFDEIRQTYYSRGIRSWAQLTSEEHRTLVAHYLRTLDPLTLLEWLAEQPELQLPMLVADVLEGKNNGIGSLACPKDTLATTIALTSWHNTETLLALEWKALWES